MQAECSCAFGDPRGITSGLGLLSCMQSKAPDEPQWDEILTLSRLAAWLGVPVQTIYDLRSQGRGPRGFRVGHELRFRRSEVETWLEQLEAADEAKHDGAKR